MSCTPIRPCGPDAPGLGIVAPPPGQRPLRRRVGDFDGFVRDLVAAVERTDAGGEPLGRRWDVEGDDRGALLVRLWAFVAEGVAAYAELTAGESYVGTASDWTDLRRVAGLVGFRPRPRIAAQGWVRTEVDPGADPVVPAGTRVQAPGTPARPSQVFEVEADTALRSEWGGLTATWVPEATVPEGREVRFLGDPGFRLGDRVLLVSETPSAGAPVSQPSWTVWGTGAWIQMWGWLLYLQRALASAATPLAVASVAARRDELGTAVITFDRDVGGVLSDPAAPYAAYRITHTAASARRLEKVVRIPATGTEADNVDLSYDDDGPIDDDTVILDAAIDELSAGQLVAVVDWSGSRCDIVAVERHEIVEWEVSPGTPARASKLTLVPPEGQTAVPALDAGHVTVHVLDRRVVARHYVLPAQMPPGPPHQLRLYPRPEVIPAHVAVRLDTGWEVLGCAESADQELLPPGGAPDAPRGLILDLDRPPAGTLADGTSAEASANLLRVRHGGTAQATLGSGDAARAGQRMTTPDAPIAYDLDAAGTPVPSQVLRVDDVAWEERESLYGAGAAQAYAARLGPDGAVTAIFGDGSQGARLPTGRGNVAATYRVGGGAAGEVESEAIDALLGSVRGVKKVSGAGPTTGGADQDDEARIRSLAPRRARAFGRAVSSQDLVDLSLGYPGVTHAAVWNGAGPPGHVCGRSGLHLAFVRASSAGPRAPLAEEVASLAAYLDARRDASVPLCVGIGVVTPLGVTAGIAADPRRDPAAVAAAATAALLDPAGPLAPEGRSLGQPVDASDLVAVIHAAEGVVGVTWLDLPGAGALGRRAAERWELLVLSEPGLSAEPAS